MAHTSLSIVNVKPSDVNVYVGLAASLFLGGTPIHNATAFATRGAQLAAIERLGDRIASDAKRAGHRYRTERRTAELARAVKAVA